MQSQKKEAVRGRPELNQCSNSKPVTKFWRKDNYIGVPDPNAYYRNVEAAKVQNAIIAAVMNKPRSYRKISEAIGFSYCKTGAHIRLLIEDGILQKDEEGIVSLVPLEVTK